MELQDLYKELAAKLEEAAFVTAELAMQFEYEALVLEAELLSKSLPDN